MKHEILAKLLELKSIALKSKIIANERYYARPCSDTLKFFREASIKYEKASDAYFRYVNSISCIDYFID